jgi:rubredoxin
MITNSGRHIQISEKRHCPRCGVFTEQVCHKIRYQENPEESGSLIRNSYWVCPTCLTETEEVKKQLISGDKVKIINRLLRMQEDYAIHSMAISSQPEKLVIEITIRD